ncbi:hypothetical protein [Deinococcus peraridilitoris]|uniref:DUF5666 domain-containing protein n=1 Tax=Deinococcus peraridilitoris (strain DSM 19664 / LMG 22246 / CIP 109416 / KR-200) TaxID=937777 RepID=K9ZYX4_DEIPD|nr:hypothetical protein [Deinococcus peraridilitoris]AFZ66102.1 hypothetical protein Deipe_0506 [Deinococcus peraridilitoris DSM 19664]
MKSIVALTALSIALVACAPAQGVPPTRYVGQSGEILAMISQYGTELRPSDQFNNFTVEAITNNGVTFVTQNTPGFQLFVGRQTVRMTFTALQAGNNVSVAGSISNGQRELIDAVFRHLDKSFQRIPNP